MSSHTDLRTRRLAMGFTEEMMAAGIGLRRVEVREIERGEASDMLLNHYAGWLTRMERWPADVLALQAAGAKDGRRFRT